MILSDFNLNMLLLDGMPNNTSRCLIKIYKLETQKSKLKKRL